MKRLFTFGCSFTNYRWSTWADCLAPEFDYFENWGQSGAGNHYIFNSVMECDQRHKLSDGDTVIVCWSSWPREDRYVDGRWITLGTTFNSPVYVKSFIDKYIDERGCLIRDLAMIKAVKVLLETRPGLTWKFLSMCSILSDDVFGDNISAQNDVADVYHDVIQSIAPSFKEVLQPVGWGGSEPNWVHKHRNGDPHPNPQEHLAYLDTVLPSWVTKEETRAKIAQETRLLEDNGYKLQNHIPRRSGLSKVSRL